jgi:hypothetical protein
MRAIYKRGVVSRRVKREILFIVHWKSSPTKSAMLGRRKFPMSPGDRDFVRRAEHFARCHRKPRFRPPSGTLRQPTHRSPRLPPAFDVIKELIAPIHGAAPGAFGGLRDFVIRRRSACNQYTSKFADLMRDACLIGGVSVQF